MTHKHQVSQDFLAKCLPVLNFFPSARLVRVLGYSKGNTGKDLEAYQKAKRPIDTGWQNKANYAPDDPLIAGHLARGGWVGLLIPDGVIVVDIDNPAIAQEIADALRRAGLAHIAIKTPHGYQFFFKDSGLVKTQGAKMLCLLGIVIDYRLPGKGQVVLPTDGTASRQVMYIPTSDNGKQPTLATLPLFFLPVRKVKEGETIKDIVLSVSEGGRNDHFNAETSRMIGYNDTCNLKLGKDTLLQSALEFNAAFCLPPLPEREASTTFESAWRSLAGKSKATAQRTETIVSDTTPFDATTLPFCFWSEELKNKTPKLKIDVELLMRFLEKEGYRKAIVTKGELQKILVYVEDNLIEEVSLSEIKNRLLSQEHEPYNYLFRLPDKISSNFNKIDLRKRLLDVINAYIEPGKLDALPVIENLNTLRDSKTVSYFFSEMGLWK